MILRRKKTLRPWLPCFKPKVWHVCARLYLNELAVQESGNAHLGGWAQGYVQVTDGDITDFDVVADDLRAICRNHNVRRKLRSTPR